MRVAVRYCQHCGGRLTPYQGAYELMSNTTRLVCTNCTWPPREEDKGSPEGPKYLGYRALGVLALLFLTVMGGGILLSAGVGVVIALEWLLRPLGPSVAPAVGLFLFLACLIGWGWWATSKR